jgi:LuxR family transcriptional regulator, maltose regulon positive regulatory protein
MLPILSTKLYIPPLQPNAIRRPRLIEKMGGGQKLTLVSAPAGFGKTTLLSEWISCCGKASAWLSLDENDNDPGRFLTYFIAAMQRIKSDFGKELLDILHSSHSPSEDILTMLINELSLIPENCTFVIDDYHIIDSQPVDKILTFLIEHLPPRMNLVIATREDPQIPLPRLRALNQLAELRAVDLRFTLPETTGFLNRTMNLKLNEDDITALEIRTEGWIAGLQLVAISMKGIKETTGFIKSFTGSHHFIMDYLIEEVLEHQPPNIHRFLLGTSILERLCGPLCDAVLSDHSSGGKEMLIQLEHANLFIIPLDNERKWYRYHHLFRDLLRQRLIQNKGLQSDDKVISINELHVRASEWYEQNNFEIEAFNHAAAANDIERAERLIEGKGMSLQFCGALNPILNWLKSLPKETLDARPSLWTTYASVVLGTGHTAEIENILQSGEAALKNKEQNEKTRDLMGRIASTRGMLAISKYQPEAIISQSLLALEYLHPENHPFRTSAVIKMGYAYMYMGERKKAKQAFSDALSQSQAAGNLINDILSSIGMGSILEGENQLKQAERTYNRILQISIDINFPIISEAYLGLARIYYEWNDPETSEHYLLKGIPISKQLQNTDRYISGEVLLARIKMVKNDTLKAADILANALESAHIHNFKVCIPEIYAAQFYLLLKKGNISEALKYAQNNLMSIARLKMAEGNLDEAISILEKFLEQMQEKNWEDKILQAKILLAKANHELGEREMALQIISNAISMAVPGDFIRIFIDEDLPMQRLLSEAYSQKIYPEYTGKLLSEFSKEKPTDNEVSICSQSQSLIDPLSQREMEVLKLISQGLSNQEISERLFLALSTIKGYNQRIFDKLNVQRRTEAIKRANDLGLL